MYDHKAGKCRGNLDHAYTDLAALIPKTRRCGAVLTVALIINTILCNGIIKPFVARPRPCDVNMAIQLLIPRPSDWSFPSGHTSAAFASASALFFHAYSSIGVAVSRAVRQQRRFGSLCATGASGCVFQAYLYVHLPTDDTGRNAARMSGWLCRMPGHEPVHGKNTVLECHSLRVIGKSHE